MWEFQFKGEGVVNNTGGILKFKLVGVVIKLENLEDLGVDIEVFVAGLFGSILKSDGSVSVNVVLGEVSLSEFLEGSLDGRVLFLVGGSVSGESIWSFDGGLTGWGGLVGGVKSP